MIRTNSRSAPRPLTDLPGNRRYLAVSSHHRVRRFIAACYHDSKESSRVASSVSLLDTAWRFRALDVTVYSLMQISMATMVPILKQMRHILNWILSGGFRPRRQQTWCTWDASIHGSINFFYSRFPISTDLQVMSQLSSSNKCTASATRNTHGIKRPDLYIVLTCMQMLRLPVHSSVHLRRWWAGPVLNVEH